MVVVKMNGEKVRSFPNALIAKAWASKHCQGKVTIVSLAETEMPKPADKIYPNLDMPDLRYRPFASVTL